MATKSENAPIINTFWPGVRSILYESVSSGCEVVELYGFWKFVIAPFSVRPLLFFTISFHSSFLGSLFWQITKMAEIWLYYKKTMAWLKFVSSQSSSSHRVLQLYWWWVKFLTWLLWQRENTQHFDQISWMFWEPIILTIQGYKIFLIHSCIYSFIKALSCGYLVHVNWGSQLH